MTKRRRWRATDRFHYIAIVAAALFGGIIAWQVSPAARLFLTGLGKVFVLRRMW